MKQLNLLKEEPKKLFFQYLFPSISATLVTSIYVLADSIIIGKGIGSDGIAALNIALPLFTLLFGIGLLFGVGGGVLMSVANGSNNAKSANEFFSTSIVCAVIISIMLLIIGNIFFKPIFYLMGATDNNYHLVHDYAIYIIYFCPIFVFSTLLQAFVRNDKAPKKSMVAVITGGITNIVLDCVFIYGMGMGMAGGAIATVIGSTVSVLILLTHFVSKSNSMKFKLTGFSLKKVFRILECGVSSFLIEISSGIVILFFNLQTLRYIGEQGVVVYSIISNSAIIAMSLFNGVAQASQPIMAVNFGAKHFDRVKTIRQIASITTVTIGLLLCLTGALFPKIIIEIFVIPTDEIMNLGVAAIRVYFTAFIFMSLNILFSNYLQSIVQPYQAMFICLLRGIILSLLLLFLLPAIFGTNALWIVMPVTEAITLVVGLFLVKKTEKNMA